MEPHEPDPTQDARRQDDPGGEEDSWRQAADHWESIGRKLRDRYGEFSAEGGPSEDEIRDAFRTLGSATQAMLDSLGGAIRDPGVRGQVKEAAASFMTAVSQSLKDLASEFRKPAGDAEQ